jgi:hypothetical protein
MLISLKIAQGPDKISAIIDNQQAALGYTI